MQICLQSYQLESYIKQSKAIPITKLHKTIESCLPVHNAMLVQKDDRQYNFSGAESRHFLRQSLHLTQRGKKSTSNHEFHHVAH
jgi:hypothetical protein